MANSRVITVDGEPILTIEGKAIPACAYVTYFDERNRYEDFTAVGYRLFSVTVSLASRPINAITGFSPYERGVFDGGEAPDFSCIDEAMEKIIKACPDAYIFPRIYTTMPKWWCEKYPSETMSTQDGNRREMLMSEQFRLDGASMLLQVVTHMREASYAKNIIGYHIAGGNTEEWFHFDKNGGYCENVIPYFKKYLAENYPGESYEEALPPMDSIYGDGRIENKQTDRYLAFANDEVANTILHFASTVKKACEYSQTVGVFHGYTLDICSGLIGDLAIEKLLPSKDIDFFCSPNSYVDVRRLGIDWGDMIASGSVKHHGKLCLLECDIRTSLSDHINNCRPGADKANKYYGPIWLGPKTIKRSISAMRKSYAHQYTHGNGMWWFDMWGGWYDHKSYRKEVRRCLSIFEKKRKNALDISPAVAMFADGQSYHTQCVGNSFYRSPYLVRNALGNAGVTYESYLLSDFEQVYKKYRAIVFAIPLMTAALQKAISICEKESIPYLLATTEKPSFSTSELRTLADTAGAHVFSRDDDVIYCGRGLLAVHAATAGEKIISLPEKCLVKGLDKKLCEETDTLTLHMEQFETRLFWLEK